MIDLRRQFNRLKIKLSYRLGISRLSSMPKMLNLDPTNHCNLKCPLCPTGLGDESVDRGTMKLEEYKRSSTNSASGCNPSTSIAGASRSSTSPSWTWSATRRTRTKSAPSPALISTISATSKSKNCPYQDWTRSSSPSMARLRKFMRSTGSEDRSTRSSAICASWSPLKEK